MPKNSDGFAQARLDGVILKKLQCSLKKYPSKESKIELTANVKLDTTLYKKKADGNFFLGLDVDLTGYDTSKNARKNVDSDLEEVLFNISCHMSGKYEITNKKYEIKKLEKLMTTFSLQLAPFIQEQIDHILFKMDLLRHGVNFPFYQFLFNEIYPIKQAMKTKPRKRKKIST